MTAPVFAGLVVVAPDLKDVEPVERERRHVDDLGTGRLGLGGLERLRCLLGGLRVGLRLGLRRFDHRQAGLQPHPAARIAQQFPGWQGFGLAVQAYQTRALELIEHVTALARKYQIKLMCRLVKGAYWDAEIKRAQEMGLPHYPVFTHKHHTDISYLACARALLDAPDAIYPQFATHNAHTVAAIHELADPATGARLCLSALGYSVGPLILDRLAQDRHWYAFASPRTGLVLRPFGERATCAALGTATGAASGAGSDE